MIPDDERPQDGKAEAEVRPKPVAHRTVTEWAQAKGHIPDPNKPIRFAGDIHRGPHIAVVRQHKRWPSNKVVTEAEYDAAVKDAYSIPVGENLADKRSGQ